MNESAPSYEKELADLLDELGIVWEYEPHHIFPDGTIMGNNYENRMKWGGDPKGFCPDFYLPEEILYVEMTRALNRGTVNHKNRKIRRAENTAPVQILILRDKEITHILACEWEKETLLMYFYDLKKEQNKRLGLQSAQEQSALFLAQK